MQTDILIIGSGIAGLSFAIKMAERKPDISICIVSKTDRFESNTKYAQGGIAAVMDNVTSSFDAHIDDTLKAGKGFSNISTVSLVVKKAPKRLEELIKWGTSFDKTKDGNWHLGLEAGHSTARILHHKDQTGWALEKALLKKMAAFKNIYFFTEHFATDLLIKNNQCYGAIFLEQGNANKFSINAKITYLATGGSGQVFARTTNPLIASGDGIAIAARAGAEMENMAFYQFHPTALAVESSNPVFLISEAVRGSGALIINKKGKRFLFEYHPDGELATRDVVTDAIFKELQSSEDNCVYLDCRHLDRKNFRAHFPNIVKQCKLAGIDVFSELIPIAPAAHYQCGGIKVDKQARTSVSCLYANGECASTGLHGANRLASNSLLEAVVFAHEAALDVSTQLDTIKSEINGYFPKAKILEKEKPDIKTVRTLRLKIQKLMFAFYLQKSLGEDLEEYEIKLNNLCGKVNQFFNYYYPEQELLELRNLSSVAQLIIKGTLYE